MNLRGRRDALLRMLRLRIRATAYLRKWIFLLAAIAEPDGLAQMLGNLMQNAVR
jgi:hypothetical protein